MLRQRARHLTLEEIKSRSIGQLLELMRETMRDAPGVGLAAPQIGESLQIAVIEDRAEYQKVLPENILREREREPIPFHVIINPTMVCDESTSATFFEGCLSVEGYAALVSRVRAVRVQCLNQHGQAQVIEARGWYARILQHEIDHLHGTLYVDRMKPRSFMHKDIYGRGWHAKAIAEIESELMMSEIK